MVESGGGYTETTGSAVYDTTGDDTNNPNVVILTKVGDELESAGYQRILSPNVEKPTHLFGVGQKIQIQDDDVTVYTIQSVDLNNLNNVLRSLWTKHL